MKVLPSQSECIKVATIGKPYGGEGVMNVMHGQDIGYDILSKCKVFFLLITNKLVPFTIEQCSKKNNHMYVKFYDIETVEQAEEIQGMPIYIVNDFEDEDEEESHYLLGYTIYSDQERIGTIEDVIEYPMHAVFEVVTADNNSVLIPFAEDLIQNIDEEAETITMTIPEGLLDLEDN